MAARSTRDDVSVRNRSWPAVSQSVSFTFLPSVSTIFTLKSTPTVDSSASSNVSSVKRFRSELLPTPESPMSKTLNK